MSGDRDYIIVMGPWGSSGPVPAECYGVGKPSARTPTTDRQIVRASYPEAVAMVHTRAKLWHVFESIEHRGPPISEAGNSFKTSRAAWRSAARRQQ